MGMKQNFFFFEKKIKMADSKNLRFSKPPILKKISQKFQGLVLELVGLTQSIEDETKARDFSYQFPTPWFSRRGEKQIPTMSGVSQEW